MTLIRQIHTDFFVICENLLNLCATSLLKRLLFTALPSLKFKYAILVRLKEKKNGVFA
jgi:hypothetical protein